MPLPDTSILACAHHKSGATYTVRTFRALSAEFDIPLWMRFYEPDDEPAGWRLCLHQHSRCADLLNQVSFRGWRSIRHPMALVYSAALYHERCEEPWVDIPLKKFTESTFFAATDGHLYNQVKDPNVSARKKSRIMNGSHAAATQQGMPAFEAPYDIRGMTYREFLASRKTLEEKVRFEMHTYSRGVISDMLRFPHDARFFTIKLEDISHDPTMDAIGRALRFLGFSGIELMTALDIASRNCLWRSGASKRISDHATTGMSTEWQASFTESVLQDFRQLFGHAECALGY